MPAPTYNPTLYEDALEVAKDALGIADMSKDKALGWRLVQTKVGDIWRPYAAAYRWLGANPDWLERSPLATMRGSVLSLPYLAAEQAAEDARLGLSVPVHMVLQPEPEPVYSGPVRMAFRI